MNEYSDNRDLNIQLMDMMIFTGARFVICTLGELGCKMIFKKKNLELFDGPLLIEE